MDSIEIYRCAIGFGINVQKPSDVTDAHMVEMAKEKVLVAAHGILHDCYLRTYDPALPHEDQHAVIRLIGDLGYGRTPIADIQTQIELDLLAEGVDFVQDRSGQLGEVYSSHLLDCFNKAKLAFEPRYDEQPDWLGLAFNLRLAKDTGRRIDPERDIEIADGVDRISNSLSGGRLEKGIEQYISDQSLLLPNCIERLIVLKGYSEARAFLPPIRNHLATFIQNEIARLRGTDHWRDAVAANVFAKCSDACLEQVDALLFGSAISADDRARLLERRETLVNYGAGSIRKNNKSGNATGIQRIHRTNKKKLPNSRSSTRKQIPVEELERILAEDHPTIREARRLIESADIGNNTRAELLKLKKGTPKHFWQVWPDLWKNFHEALVRVADKQNESRKNAN